jgi:thioredoxin reductase
MSDPEQYDAIVIGGGKGGKTLAMYLVSAVESKPARDGRIKTSHFFV